MRAPRSLGNLRGSLPNSLHRSHFPTTGLALARTDRRSHHRRRHPRPFGPQCPSHRDARRVHAKKPQPTQGSKPAMIPIFYIRKQGQRGCCPFPLHPKSPPNLTFASLRTIRSCLTIPNTYSTITMPASLRSDCCSPSLRNAVRLPSGIDVHLHRNTHHANRGSALHPEPRGCPRVFGWFSGTTQRRSGVPVRAGNRPPFFLQAPGLRAGPSSFSATRQSLYSSRRCEPRRTVVG